MPRRQERKRLQEQRLARQAAARQRMQERTNRIDQTQYGENVPIAVAIDFEIDANEFDNTHAPLTSILTLSCPSIEEGERDLDKMDCTDVETDVEVEANPSFAVPSDEEEQEEEKEIVEEATEIDDTIECLICMEELGDERPLADVSTWDLDNHTNVSPLCCVVAHICGECLDYYVNMHERDVEREGCFPCPLCRVGLREPIAENNARKTCAKIVHSSEKFQDAYATFLAYLMNTTPHRRLAKHQLSRLGDFVQAQKDSLIAVPEAFKSELWYRNAHTIRKHHSECHRTACRRYRELFPAILAVPEGAPHPPDLDVVDSRQLPM